MPGLSPTQGSGHDEKWGGGRWTTGPLNPEQKMRKRKKNRTEKDDPPGPHLQRLLWLLQSKNTPNSGLLQGFLGGRLSTSSHILQVPSGLVRAATDRLHRQSRPLSDQHLPPCPGSDQFSGSSLQFLSSPASARQKKKKEERVKTPKQLLLVSHDRHAALIPSLSFYFILLFSKGKGDEEQEGLAVETDAQGLGRSLLCLSTLNSRGSEFGGGS